MNAVKVVTDELSTKLKLMENENRPPDLHKDESKTTRRCASCLKICGFPVNVCGGCRKRAYCSEKCRDDDWSVNGTLQRHANWCTTFECGEEDVDWEVVPVPGKGMGIRTKRMIPAGYRVIVDAVYTDPHGHLGIMDLAPEGASLDIKFFVNSFTGNEFLDGGKDYVAVRISRSNHNCRPNVGHVYDDKARVQILFAQRDIHPGEEVCLTYCSFANFKPERISARPIPEEEFQAVRNMLLSFWGITCSKECFCNDHSIQQLVLEGRKLDKEMKALAEKGWTEDALLAGEKLVDIQTTLNVSWLDKARTNFFCFQIALQRRKTLHRARKHIQAAYDVYKTICPYSENTLKYERLLDHPETDDNYLCMEKIADPQ